MLRINLRSKQLRQQLPLPCSQGRSSSLRCRTRLYLDLSYRILSGLEDSRICFFDHISDSKVTMVLHLLPSWVNPVAIAFSSLLVEVRIIAIGTNTSLICTYSLNHSFQISRFFTGSCSLVLCISAPTFVLSLLLLLGELYWIRIQLFR